MNATSGIYNPIFNICYIRIGLTILDNRIVALFKSSLIFFFLSGLQRGSRKITTGSAKISNGTQQPRQQLQPDVYRRTTADGGSTSRENRHHSTTGACCWPHPI